MSPPVFKSGFLVTPEKQLRNGTDVTHLKRIARHFQWGGEQWFREPVASPPPVADVEAGMCSESHGRHGGTAATLPGRPPHNGERLLHHGPLETNCHRMLETPNRHTAVTVACVSCKTCSASATASTVRSISTSVWAAETNQHAEGELGMWMPRSSNAW